MISYYSMFKYQITCLLYLTLLICTTNPTLLKDDADVPKSIYSEDISNSMTYNRLPPALKNKGFLKKINEIEKNMESGKIKIGQMTGKYQTKEMYMYIERYLNIFIMQMGNSIQCDKIFYGIEKVYYEIMDDMTYLDCPIINEIIGDQACVSETNHFIKKFNHSLFHIPMGNYLLLDITSKKLEDRIVAKDIEEGDIAPLIKIQKHQVEIIKIQKLRYQKIQQGLSMLNKYLDQINNCHTLLERYLNSENNEIPAHFEREGILDSFNFIGPVKNKLIKKIEIIRTEYKNFTTELQTIIKCEEISENCKEFTENTYIKISIENYLNNNLVKVFNKVINVQINGSNSIISRKIVDIKNPEPIEKTTEIESDFDRFDIMKRWKEGWPCFRNFEEKSGAYKLTETRELQIDGEDSKWLLIAAVFLGSFCLGQILRFK